MLCPEFHLGGIFPWQSMGIPPDFGHITWCQQRASMVQILLVVEGVVANSTKNCRDKHHAKHTRFHSHLLQTHDMTKVHPGHLAEVMQYGMYW
jgi:hypothetical protein